MRLTWWGHSTATVADGGVRVLTDPVLGNRLAHLRRRAGAQPPPSVINVDAVIVSHLHADHLDVSSLRALDPATLLLVPRGGADVLRHRLPSLARACLELVPGDRVDVGHLSVEATPADHSGARGPWSRHTGPALGFVISAGNDGSDAGTNVRTWFAGDTGLGEFMRELGPIDATLIPVGGWGPSLGKQHLDPARAVEALRRIDATLAVPIHYGTLWPIGANRLRPDLFAPPGLEFARRAAAAGCETRVVVLGHGESVEVPRRSTVGTLETRRQ